MNLHTWAIRWGVGPEALRELQTLIGTYTPPLPPDAPEAGKSEAYVASVLRLEASRKGVRLFRNNVGALTPKGSSRPVRYGLANDSANMNEVLKSSDFIGWRPFIVRPEHVGMKVAQATGRETKPVGWQFNSNDPHEVAQLAWINLMLSDGGDACFCTGEGTL
jgi:hypothetical protein